MAKKDFVLRGILDNDAFFPMSIEDEMYNSVTNYVYANLVTNSSTRHILATAPLRDIQSKKTSEVVTAINTYLEYLDNKEDIHKKIHDEVFENVTLKKNKESGDKKYYENMDIELFEKENALIQQYYEDNIQESVSIIEEYFQNRSIRLISIDQLINEKDKISADNIKQDNLFTMYNAASSSEYENELKRLFKEGYLQIFDEKNWNSSNFESNKKIRNVLIASGLTPIVSGDPDNFIGNILMEIRHNLISKIITNRHDEKTDIMYKMYIIQRLLNYDLSHAIPIEDTWINKNFKSLDDVISMFKDVISMFTLKYSHELFDMLSLEMMSRETFVSQLKQNKIDPVIIDSYNKQLSVRDFIFKVVNSFYSNKRDSYIEQATNDIIFDEYLLYNIYKSTDRSVYNNKFEHFYPVYNKSQYWYKNQLSIQKSKKSLTDLQKIKDRVLTVYKNNKLPDELTKLIGIKIEFLKKN
jgi:hypothetical protein